MNPSSVRACARVIRAYLKMRSPQRFIALLLVASLLAEFSTAASVHSTLAGSSMPAPVRLYEGQAFVCALRNFIRYLPGQGNCEDFKTESNLRHTTYGWLHFERMVGRYGDGSMETMDTVEEYAKSRWIRGTGILPNILLGGILLWFLWHYAVLIVLGDGGWEFHRLLIHHGTTGPLGHAGTAALAGKVFFDVPL